jgi:methylated-DNA-[protein]-cysteine S-methyltransferase
MKPVIDAVLSVSSPIGPISLLSENSRLVRVELGRKLRNIGHDEILLEAASQIEQYFKGNLVKFNLPTKVQGTPFQKAIWREISKTHFGKTLSYGEIAKRIGSPLAARAVGQAVGQNPLPLIVGCHRILGSSGKITGFTGAKGISTKAWLLKHEGISFRV